MDKAAVTNYLIYKNGRGFYRPHSAGYTESIFEAGLYSCAEAMDLAESGPTEIRIIHLREIIERLHEEFRKTMQQGMLIAEMLNLARFE